MHQASRGQFSEDTTRTSSRGRPRGPTVRSLLRPGARSSEIGSTRLAPDIVTASRAMARCHPVQPRIRLQTTRHPERSEGSPGEAECRPPPKATTLSNSNPSSRAQSRDLYARHYAASAYETQHGGARLHPECVYKIEISTSTHTSSFPVHISFIRNTFAHHQGSTHDATPEHRRSTPRSRI